MWLVPSTKPLPLFAVEDSSPPFPLVALQNSSFHPRNREENPVIAAEIHAAKVHIEILSSLEDSFNKRRIQRFLAVMNLSETVEAIITSIALIIVTVWMLTLAQKYNKYSPQH